MKPTSVWIMDRGRRPVRSRGCNTRCTASITAGHSAIDDSERLSTEPPSIHNVMWIMVWTEADSIVDTGVDSAVDNVSVHVTG